MNVYLFLCQYVLHVSNYQCHHVPIPFSERDKVTAIRLTVAGALDETHTGRNTTAILIRTVFFFCSKPTTRGLWSYV